MKKIIVILLITVVILSIGAVAFASDSTPEWFKEMIFWRKNIVKEELELGRITDEEAKYWNEHIENMEEFHNKNGFSFSSGCGFRRRGFGRGF